MASGLGRPLIALATLTLASCAPAQPTPLPTVVLAGGGPAASAPAPPAPREVATASGYVVAREVQLAFAASDRITRIAVDVGDTVVTGQILAELDDTALRGQIAQADAAWRAALANVDVIQAGPTDAQLREARAAVVVAGTAYSRTLEASSAADVEAARASVAAAQARYDQVHDGSAAAAASAALRTAEAALRLAQGAYDRAYTRNPSAIGADPSALALERATNDQAAARAVYESAAGSAAETAAYHALALARAALARAQRPYTDLDRDAARATLEAAQARLDGLAAGPRIEQLRAARAVAEQAEAALAAARAQASRYVMTAPARGVIARRAAQPGEFAAAGAPILVLADLDALRVETSDLGERDLPAVVVGQAARVTFKALNQAVMGKVTAIAPKADRLGGDVVYRVTLELDTKPAGLRAGMSAEVVFGR